MTRNYISKDKYFGKPNQKKIPSPTKIIRYSSYYEKIKIKNSARLGVRDRAYQRRESVMHIFRCFGKKKSRLAVRHF
ncbi:hypothetical protein, partial [Serratia nevei]|uniref:hypothetical protein n=1 Tax=Serratia nevei TaxID=2703794 RepID=UPI003FA69513